MPCTKTQSEWQNIADAITIVENLLKDSETTLLGYEILLDVRDRLYFDCINDVQKCDELNADNPIPQEDCPIFKILQAKLKKQQEERHNGPDGFFD